MKLRRRQFIQALALGLGSAALAPLAGPADARTGLVPAASASLLPPLTNLLGAIDRALPLHPLLQHGALTAPAKQVRVIVQKVSALTDARLIAALVGATVLEEFPFVKSFVLTVPQVALLTLVTNPLVLYISPDGPVQKHGTPINPQALQTLYPREVNAPQVWNGTPAATGQGVTVAVVDSGLASHPDLTNVVAINVNQQAANAGDGHGHGTHIAATIKGRDRLGQYIGIAPDARLYSVKIADDTGAASVSDLLRGLQWVYDNRARTGIRIVNLSVTGGIPEAYLTSPLCAAVEQLWFNGVAVVVVAGNRGNARGATWYPPANDPYVITVGALDDNLTLTTADDRLAAFSSRGRTQTLGYKPDLIAPGRRIVAALASSSCVLAQEYPDRITADRRHIRLTGTSMAAPVVTGVGALLLQQRPALTPNQLKWALTTTARRYAGMPDSAGVVDAVSASSAVRSGTLGTANQGVLLRSLGVALPLGQVLWSTAYWDTAYWDTAYWDTAYWDTAYWDTAYWDVSPGQD